MRLVLILSAVGIAIVALGIFFALKTAHADDPQRQKTSRVEKTVPANTGVPLSGADPRGGTGTEVAAPPAVSTGTKREKVERKGKERNVGRYPLLLGVALQEPLVSSSAEPFLQA